MPRKMIPIAAKERDRKCGRDRSEGGRIGGPDDGEHEDQPDMVGLPDRRHRRMRVLADRLRLPAPAGGELPEAGAEVGATEHGVEGQPDQREDQRDQVQVQHQSDSTADRDGSSSSGLRARRQRIQATAAISRT